MRINTAIAVGALILLSLSAGDAWAQSTFRGGSSTSTFGNRTLGSGVNSRSGSGGSMGVQSAEQVGQLTGSERFVRENRQPGQFVGADTADAGSFVGQVGSTGGTGIGQSGLGGLGGLGGRNSRGGLQNQLGVLGLSGGLNGLGGQNFQNQNFNNAGQNFGGGAFGNTARTMPRSVIRVGFQVPAANPSVVSTRTTARIARIPKAHLSGDIVVQMEGTTAVLTGAVASESHGDLAARLVMLEPGVEAVRNELVVDPSVGQQ